MHAQSLERTRVCNQRVCAEGSSQERARQGDKFFVNVEFFIFERRTPIPVFRILTSRAFSRSATRLVHALGKTPKHVPRIMKISLNRDYARPEDVMSAYKRARRSERRCIRQDGGTSRDKGRVQGRHPRDHQCISTSLYTFLFFSPRSI